MAFFADHILDPPALVIRQRVEHRNQDLRVFLRGQQPSERDQRIYHVDPHQILVILDHIIHHVKDVFLLVRQQNLQKASQAP